MQSPAPLLRTHTIGEDLTLERRFAEDFSLKSSPDANRSTVAIRTVDTSKRRNTFADDARGGNVAGRLSRALTTPYSAVAKVQVPASDVTNTHVLSHARSTSLLAPRARRICHPAPWRTWRTWQSLACRARSTSHFA